jgi:hypothetical protein
MNISRAAKIADRIEIRLTGLDKGHSEDLYVRVSSSVCWFLEVGVDDVEDGGLYTRNQHTEEETRS